MFHGSSFVEGVIAVDISAHEFLSHCTTFQGPNRWETPLGSGYLSKPALLTSSRPCHVVHELSSENRQKSAFVSLSRLLMSFAPMTAFRPAKTKAASLESKCKTLVIKTGCAVGALFALALGRLKPRTQG